MSSNVVDIPGEVDVSLVEALRSHRAKFSVHQAIRDADLIFYATDLEGNIAMSTGGGLPRIGLAEGQLVGHNINEWPRTAERWAAAKRELMKRERAIREGGNVPNGSDSVSFTFLGDGPWADRVFAVLFSLMRAASGRVVGIGVIVFAINHLDCGMGSCPLVRAK